MLLGRGLQKRRRRHYLLLMLVLGLRNLSKVLLGARDDGAERLNRMLPSPLSRHRQTISVICQPCIVGVSSENLGRENLIICHFNFLGRLSC